MLLTKPENRITIRMDYCICHGFTEFYKNGKCKECVKYSKLRKIINRKHKETLPI